MKWPFVIILSGPPAVGKNTVAGQLCDAYPLRIAAIDLDLVKRLIPHAPNTDFFLDLASALGRSMLPIYMKAGISVVIHKPFCSFDYVRPFIDISRECGADYRYFKLTAPLEELLKRNPDRPIPSPEADLRRIYDSDKTCAHPEGITIDTVQHGIEGTVKRILESV
jgi:predicted kinase